ncbi:MAG: FAD binding domain-containing protein [Thermaerobacter sp.]|nr:FAD binding domain-containing protein [Thermaerobacter sp.]
MSSTAWLRPRTAAEVTMALGLPGARILAGGTDLVPNRTWELDTGTTWVGIGAVPGTREVRCDAAGRWEVGAAVTLAEVLAHPQLGRHYPLWMEAMRAVATPEIRTQATVGGNLCVDTRCRFRNQPPIWRSGLIPCFKSGGDRCYAAPASRLCVAMLVSDSAPVLMAMGAEAAVAGPFARWIALADLYSGDGDRHLTLNPGEWVRAIRLPAKPPLGAFRKWRPRATMDFPEVDVAVSVDCDEEPRVVRIVVSAVGPVPVRATSAETLLESGPWTSERLAEAADRARAAVHPYDNGQLRVWGRQRAVHGLVLDALRQVASAVVEKGAQA